jgi:hypothetical protein
MGRVRYLAVVALAAPSLLASCGVTHAGTALGGKSWWAQARASACVPAAFVRVDGHVTGVGNCAGMLVVPALKVTLDAGQQIGIHMMEEGTGPHGNQMVPAIPLPRSSRSSVVRLGTVSSDHATGTYQAIRPGHAALISSPTWCHVTRHRQLVKVSSSCPVVEVTVVP